MLRSYARDKPARRRHRAARSLAVLLMARPRGGAACVAVLSMAFAKGFGPFLAAIHASRHAVGHVASRLITTAIAVPLNAVFGVTAAWAITKFDFRGKSHA